MPCMYPCELPSLLVAAIGVIGAAAALLALGDIGAAALRIRLVPCDCASADRPIATTALQHSNAVAKWMRNLIPESPLQSDGRAFAGATCAGVNAQSRDVWPRTHQSLAPTVKVFFNIGSGRIDTLLIFGINLTRRKIVRTGSSVKVYATGKVSHDPLGQRDREHESAARLRPQKTARTSGDDTSASRDHRGPFDRASGATAGFDAGDSGDGDAGTKTRPDEFDRRAWRSWDGRQRLASRALASTVPYRFA
jgi:hypothetical protein